MAEALERVTRALAAMTPGPWVASDEYVWQVLDGGGFGHLIQGAGYEGEMRPEDATGIATLRNDTAQALAEARAEGKSEGVLLAFGVAADEAEVRGHGDLAQVFRNVSGLDHEHERQVANAHTAGVRATWRAAALEARRQAVKHRAYAATLPGKSSRVRNHREQAEVLDNVAASFEARAERPAAPSPRGGA